MSDIPTALSLTGLVFLAMATICAFSATFADRRAHQKRSAVAAWTFVVLSCVSFLSAIWAVLL